MIVSIPHAKTTCNCLICGSSINFFSGEAQIEIDDNGMADMSEIAEALKEKIGNSTYAHGYCSKHIHLAKPQDKECEP